ncbi:hypothetical protein H4J42_13975, partial [Colwellia sp. BRX8-8]|nr:hypothetical protein [Colwellia sp. BRX8-8]
MSYSFVRTMAQDEDGFMWFGSSEGLDRFDGHQTLNFQHDSTQPNSLSSSVISSILFDKQQRLWAQQTNQYIAEVKLIEGRYHQIKRMFGRFRNPVIGLHRQAIGN